MKAKIKILFNRHYINITQSALQMCKTFIVVIGFFICYGCNQQQNKEYVRQQVVDMYADCTMNPLYDMTAALNNFSSISDFQDRINRATKKMEDFNSECTKRINKDPVLKKYFQSFIKNYLDSNVSINDINYYGITIRKNLETDLEIKLME